MIVNVYKEENHSTIIEYDVDEYDYKNWLNEDEFPILADENSLLAYIQEASLKGKIVDEDCKYYLEEVHPDDEVNNILNTINNDELY